MSGRRFGVSVVPDLAAVRTLTAIAEEADRSGLDYLGVQDHPYVARYLDSFVLAGHLLSHTLSLSVLPDVANLPLRPPGVLARTAASLNILSGGRFVLGLGAGASWDAIGAMGADVLSRADALAALDEAIGILRTMWTPGSTTSVDGRYYRSSGVHGADPGPGGIEIWVGAQARHSLALTGRLADGWAAPIPSYLPYERWAGANRRIDESAVSAGRRPSDIRRVAQVVGEITASPTRAPNDLTSGSEVLRGDSRQWVRCLSDLLDRHAFDAIVFWPSHTSLEQVQRFGREVAPSLRTAALEG